jgi:hemolysin III
MRGDKDMGPQPRAPQTYTRAERVSDAAVHVTGVISSLIAVPILVTLAIIWFDDRATVIAALVYGLSLIAVISCSAVNHMAPLPDWKGMLRRIDQAAIYLVIAGTFTPFAVLTGVDAGIFLTGIWGAAFAGVALIAFSPVQLKWPTLALYLAIAWFGVLAGHQLFSELDPAAFTLIAAGGCLYTFGVVFFVWERLPFHNTIWHVFVLAASGILYAAVLVELWDRAHTL